MATILCTAFSYSFSSTQIILFKFHSSLLFLRAQLTGDKLLSKLIMAVVFFGLNGLTHWGLVTHISVSKIIIIGSDNGLSPGRRQAIIWTNDGILLIGHLRTNFGEIWIQINTFSFTKMNLKMSSGKCRPYCLGLNVLRKYLFTSIWVSTGGGITKPKTPPFRHFLTFFSTLKTRYWISCLYLTGVTAAQLQWHLSNINVIQII